MHCVPSVTHHVPSVIRHVLGCCTYQDICTVWRCVKVSLALSQQGVGAWGGQKHLLQFRSPSVKSGLYEIACVLNVC